MPHTDDDRLLLTRVSHHVGEFWYLDLGPCVDHLHLHWMGPVGYSTILRALFAVAPRHAEREVSSVGSMDDLHRQCVHGSADIYTGYSRSQ